jgi:hypothetical protein
MPALDRYIHSKYKVSNTWFDQLFYRWSSRNRQRNHVDSSTSFADNDIEIIDHYTTDSEMRLPKVWVASIKIHDRLRSWNSSQKRDRRMSVQSYRKSLWAHYSITCLTKMPLVRLSIFESYCNLGWYTSPYFQTGYSSTRPHHLDETSTRTNVRVHRMRTYDSAILRDTPGIFAKMQLGNIWNRM